MYFFLNGTPDLTTFLISFLAHCTEEMFISEPNDLFQARAASLMKGEGLDQKTYHHHKAFALIAVHHTWPRMCQSP